MTSPLIGRFCGSEIPARIKSFGHEIYLHFHTDNSMSGPGFSMSWTSTSDSKNLSNLKRGTQFSDKVKVQYCALIVIIILPRNDINKKKIA